jgi:hypothetical protein
LTHGAETIGAIAAFVARILAMESVLQIDAK